MKKLVLAIIPLIFLAGCKTHGVYVPTSKEYTNQPEVVRIVTVDGTTLYRIYDGGYVYFSSRGTAWSTTESCGKNCTTTKHHQVPNES